MLYLGRTAKHPQFIVQLYLFVRHPLGHSCVRFRGEAPAKRPQSVRTASANVLFTDATRPQNILFVDCCPSVFRGSRVAVSVVLGVCLWLWSRLRCQSIGQVISCLPPFRFDSQVGAVLSVSLLMSYAMASHLGLGQLRFLFGVPVPLIGHD